MSTRLHNVSEYKRTFKKLDTQSPLIAGPVAGKSSAAMQPTFEPPIQRKARSPSPTHHSMIMYEPSSSERRVIDQQDDYFLLGNTDKFSQSLPYRNSMQKTNGMRHTYSHDDGSWVATGIPQNGRDFRTGSLDRHYYKERKKHRDHESDERHWERSRLKNKGVQVEPRHHKKHYDERHPDRHYEDYERDYDHRHEKQHDRYYEDHEKDYDHRYERQHDRYYGDYEKDHDRRYRKHHDRHREEIYEPIKRTLKFDLKNSINRRTQYNDTDEVIVTPDAPRTSEKYLSEAQSRHRLREMGRTTMTVAPPPTVKEPINLKRGSYLPVDKHNEINSRNPTHTEYRKNYHPFVFAPSRRKRASRSAPPDTKMSHTSNQRTSNSPPLYHRRFVTEYSEKFKPIQVITKEDEELLQERRAQQELVEINRLRNRGTHFSREHLGQLLSNNNELWTAPLDTPPYRYEMRDDEEYVSGEEYESERYADENIEVMGKIPTRIPKNIEGRLPTPQIRTYNRHHLDRTTPAVGGSLLTSSHAPLIPDESERRHLVKDKRNVTFSQPYAGKPSIDSHDILNESANYDTPVKLNEPPRSYSTLSNGSSRSSKSSKSSKASASRSSTTVASSSVSSRRVYK